MSTVNNSQSFTAGASGIIGAGAQAKFKRAMDINMVGLGRDIIIHLPPAKTDCTDPSSEYDSFYDKHMSVTGAVCETCKGQGFYVEPRQTIYRANVRWTDEPYNLNRFGSTTERDFEFGRKGVNFCRTKTVSSSFQHVSESIGATIDGQNVEIFEAPRYTAFGDVLYVVTFWQVASR